MTSKTIMYKGREVEVGFEYIPPYYGSAWDIDSSDDYYGIQELTSAYYVDTEEDLQLNDKEEMEIWKLILEEDYE